MPVPVITGDTWFLVVALGFVAAATVVAWLPWPRAQRLVKPCRVVTHPSGAAVCYEHSTRWGRGGHCPSAP